tara:strand:- start:531 stop:956 length:426 start_codon:yes stop_codon:yes gene_type:complete
MTIKEKFVCKSCSKVFDNEHDLHKHDSRYFREKLFRAINVNTYVYNTLLSNNNSIDNRLDILFNYINNLLCSDSFETVDKFIDIVKVDKLELTLIIGILTITLAAKYKLHNREAFVNKVYEYLEATEPDKERRINLLKGLK